MLFSCGLSWLYHIFMQICEQQPSLSFKLLLEKPYRLIPPSGLWGSRRRFRKRGGGADCFWKYCVWGIRDILNWVTGFYSFSYQYERDSLFHTHPHIYIIQKQKYTEHNYKTFVSKQLLHRETDVNHLHVSAILSTYLQLLCVCKFFYDI